MSSETAPLLLKMTNWPEADRMAWDALFADGNILDGRGPCFHWPEGSRWKRKQSYSRWLAFLAGQGALKSPGTISDRATTDTVSAFIACERERCKAITVYMRLEDLWFLFQVLDPKRNWEWLRGIVLRLRAATHQ